MSNAFAGLPIPPDGFGAWHQWNAPELDTRIRDRIPSFLAPNDQVFYMMRSGDSSVQPAPVRHITWEECGSATTTFFCLRHDHPYNTHVPDPIAPVLDLTGMDRNVLWGTF